MESVPDQVIKTAAEADVFLSKFIPPGHVVLVRDAHVGSLIRTVLSRRRRGDVTIQLSSGETM